MKDFFKKILPYLIILVSFCAIIFIFFIVIDSYILPSFVHNIEKVSVPDVTGKPLAEAQSMLNRRNLFSHKQAEQYSEDVPPNYVISQSPKPGTIVKIGRHINITISKGGETVTVPDIYGEAVRTAKVTLMRKGLQLGDIAYVFCDSVGTDTIVAQNIQAGRQVSYGSIISVFVSKGPENQIIMPLLVGKDLEEVKKLIAASGLTLGSINYSRSETYQANTVLDQSPDDGEMVLPNATVNLIIAR